MRIAELVNVARPTDTVVLDQIIADQASFPIIGCSNWEDATFTEWRPHWTDHLQWLKNLPKSLTLNQKSEYRIIKKSGVFGGVGYFL